MVNLGVFVCVREYDLKFIPHIVAELSKQKGVPFNLHVIIHSNRPSDYNSFKGVVVHNFISDDIGKLYVFKYVQSLNLNYKYYLFSDSDLFLSDSCIYNLVTSLKNSMYNYTSASALPITYISKNPSLLEKQNILKIEFESTIFKIKPHGAFILFKSIFFNKINFKNISKINEDRWIYSKYKSDFMPCFYAYYFYFLPSTFKDRINQHSRTLLGRYLISGFPFKINVVKTYNFFLDLIAKTYVYYLLLLKLIGFNYWKNIPSTKPGFKKRIYYSKNYFVTFKNKGDFYRK